MMSPTVDHRDVFLHEVRDRVFEMFELYTKRRRQIFVLVRLTDPVDQLSPLLYIETEGSGFQIPSSVETLIGLTEAAEGALPFYDKAEYLISLLRPDAPPKGWRRWNLRKRRW
jgi:hypothetical protein